MATLPETPQWEDGIYQIEVSDPVLGGPDGLTNRPAKQLASRTLYLKQHVEETGQGLASHIAAADPHSQYAPKNSPVLTGIPTAPTAPQTTNNQQLANTAFVKAAIAALVASSPAALDTLNELAEALGNDPNFATTMTNALANKQPLDNTLTALSGKTVSG
ncbi:TPA: phage tail protein, partial [Citrobacter farmeri]